MPEGFEGVGIRRELVEALAKSGLKHPTPVQERAIPLLLEGRDVIAQAQTGTGKTLAFLLPILQRIDVTQPVVQALVLTPTRELALQITAEAKKLAPIVGAGVLATYGGQDVESQVKKLAGGVHLVIATPGRLLDHLQRGTVRLNRLSMLVLDEADQMLHMGFLDDVTAVIEQTSANRSTLLFSATMPDQIRALARRYMRSPVEVVVRGKQITLEEIEQVVVETTDREKQDALCRKLDEYNPYLAVIFCRTKIRADNLHDALITRGYNADVLHGDLSQNKREQVMKRFRAAESQILVATDVAARGIDVEGVSHVFNYDIPQDAEGYIHRIGRTGRAGQTGMAVTFVTPRDQAALRQIEHGVQTSLARVNAQADRDATRVARRPKAVRQVTPQERPEREQRPEGVSRREWAAMQGKTAVGAPGATRGKGAAAGGRRGTARVGTAGATRGTARAAGPRTPRER